MTNGGQTMNPPLQQVRIPLFITTLSLMLISESNDEEGYEGDCDDDDEKNIIKSECKLTKGHEGSHDNLVPRYDAISIEQSNGVNYLLYIAHIENQNALLKDLVDKLTSKNLALLEKHNMLLVSHEKLIDDHIMSIVAHEVVVFDLSFSQPHICTCIHSENNLACVNPGSQVR
jgi:hypothetical protein